MAERMPTLTSKGDETAMKPGQQMIQMFVWPVDPKTRKPIPAKTVEVKNDDGKIVKKDIARIPIFRMKAGLADIDGWRLSAFYQEFLKSLWPNWDVTQDVEDMKSVENPEDAPSYSMPVISVTDLVDERKNITASVKQSVQYIHLPYKVTDAKGAFGFDRQTNKTLPLNEGSIHYLAEAFRTQSRNPDTCGLKGVSASPRILWCPFAEPHNNFEKKEIEEYEENLVLMKSWVGKLVYWEREEVDMSRPKR